MPVVFIGHGSPMNAIEDNRWSRGFAELGQSLPRPRAILTVSAHWYLNGTFLTGNTRPRTIHDFRGFPPELHAVQYPAPGSPDVARRVRDLLSREGSASLSEGWGLDHGTWSVLVHMFPEADIPVVQLSLNDQLTGQQHVDLGKALAPLREEGVLILGSGNVVHNLRDAISHMRSGDATTPDWARRYDADIAAALTQHDIQALLARHPGTPEGKQAHPWPDHWLPLLYAAGAATQDDAVRFPIEGFDWGSLSMRAAVFG